MDASVFHFEGTFWNSTPNILRPLSVYHVGLACLKVRVGILFHKHLFQSTGYVIYSPHIYPYTFFLEVRMSGSHETMFCRLFFTFLFSTNNVWSLIYLLLSINFIFYYKSRITTWNCTTSAQQYCYMVWSIDWLQGPHKCSAFTSIALHVCSGVLFHIHSCFRIYFLTRACNTVLFLMHYYIISKMNKVVQTVLLQ